MRRVVLFSMLLLGCPAPDEDPVTVRCTYAYQFEDRVDTGLYEEFTLTCDQYRLSGWQSLESTRFSCEEDGRDQGATAVECDCEFDVPPSCDPDSIND